MIVMKFGGTSVEDASAIDRVATIVKSRQPERPFVVVSAMAKVTDQLLAMAAAAGSGDRDKALDICRTLRERHYNVAGELLATGLHTDLHTELGAEFDSLDELLRGISAVGELTPRTSDYVLSFGERLSSMVITAAFLARDIPASLADARQIIITDAQTLAGCSPNRRNKSSRASACETRSRPRARTSDGRLSLERPSPVSPPPSVAVVRTSLLLWSAQL